MSAYNDPINHSLSQKITVHVVCTKIFFISPCQITSGYSMNLLFMEAFYFGKNIYTLSTVSFFLFCRYSFICIA